MSFKISYGVYQFILDPNNLSGSTLGYNNCISSRVPSGVISSNMSSQSSNILQFFLVLSPVSSSPTVQLFNARTFAHIITFPLEIGAPIYCALSFSPDGCYLATGTKTGMIIILSVE